jgi:hypothetical protein
MGFEGKAGASLEGPERGNVTSVCPLASPPQRNPEMLRGCRWFSRFLVGYW